MSAPLPVARRIAFRFGLKGRRWGETGPFVLLLHGHHAEPASFAQLVRPLIAAGRQVVVLEDPTRDTFRPDRVDELAAAIAEAAVEIPDLEAVVAHGVAADAAARALGYRGLFAQRVALLATGDPIEAMRDLHLPVLFAAGNASRDQILDFVLERDTVPLAA